MTDERHWNRVHGTQEPDAVSWFRPHLERSLAFLDRADLDLDEPIIDVGGGTSTWVDDLLDRGYRDLTVLDISAVAIDHARARLGARASGVTWIVGDVTRVELPEGRFAFWHDRAVFHFLTAAEDRRAYVATVRHALRPGGHIVVATFGPAGPEQCSGLDVARYDAEALHAEFGPSFCQIASQVERHVTPWGTDQEFVYCYFRR